MMLLPTQDKELRNDLIEWLADYDASIETSNSPLVSDAIDQITKIFEKHGYHKGLPASIEEALNSGDGSYRP